jgi:Na+/H+-dicarboxylate symporter
MSGLRFHWQMLIAMVLAGLAGSMAGADTTLAGLPLAGLFDFLGTLFLSALRMLVVPLACASIIVAVADFRSTAELGRMGLRAVSLYLGTTIAAIVTGLVLANAVEPGIDRGRPAAAVLAPQAATADLAEELSDKGFVDVLDVLLSVVPSNVLGAAAAEDLLGLIFFSALFGYFLARLGHGYADPLYRFWSGVARIMMLMTGWVMKFAPIGVFGLVAGTFARTGLDAVPPLLAFAGVVLAALGVHAVVTLPVLVAVVGRVSPVGVYRAVAPAFLTGLATASSTATLPVTMACVEQRAGVSSRVASLILPLGSTVNMNGTALYQGVAALFLAQAYGVDLDPGLQLTVLALAVVTSIGVPGLPEASLASLAVILSAIGVPAEALGVLLVLDRLLAMARTAVNVLGDAVCAVLVARLEGEPGGGRARQD